MPEKKFKPKHIILLSVIFLLAALIIFIFVSPVPISYIIRSAFNKKIAVPPDNYTDIQNNAEVVKNLKYPSEYKDNTADIYLPKNKENVPFPVVLWIHGGAFVGGDKEDIEIYATNLASEGFAVVCMNYKRAPEAKYPVPLIQTDEVYNWIQSISEQYHFDTTRFIIAGDSAGAHIAAQFAAIQSNPDYADEMGFIPVVPLNTFKAILLFCGPFDVAELDKGNNAVLDFLMGRAAWVYFGKKNWADDFAYQATIANHITDKFPPSFISDGNSMSFEKHGRDLADALKNKGVLVETYFIPVEKETAAHEYQFIMNAAAGKESFDKTLDFIRGLTE